MIRVSHDRTRRAAFLIAAWSIPAATAVLQQAALYIMRGNLGREWPWALIQFPKWLSWALITPLIIRLIEWRPLERDRILRAAFFHVAAAVVIALLFEIAWVGPTILLERMTGPGTILMVSGGVLKRTKMTFFSRFLNSILPRVMSGVVTYMAVAGLAMTLRYRTRLSEKETASAKLEADLAIAQVQALKMQVHPHFLFNTLHAVTVLIREDQDAAVRTVTQLGDLLRTTLSRAARTEVSLREELETLRLFLDIEATRFENRLHVTWDIDPDVLDASVPDLVLQPLVENAIRHGIEERVAPGFIRVYARGADDRLVLEVSDNGVGIRDTDDVTEGIGLATTRARLARLYENDSTLQLFETDGGGCTARIDLPLRMAHA